MIFCRPMMHSASMRFADGPDRVRSTGRSPTATTSIEAASRSHTTSAQAAARAARAAERHDKTDEYFGKQEIYHRELVGELPVARAAGRRNRRRRSKVTYQGCAEAGLCYPPITKTLHHQPAARRAQRRRGSSPSRTGSRA